MKRLVVRRKAGLAMAVIMTFGLGAAVTATPALATVAETPVPGVTMVADPESPTGYTGTFVYYNPNATQVKLSGAMSLYDVATGTGTTYEPEEWQNGRYHAAGFLRDMVKDADGYWSISVPMHAGIQIYLYSVWDPTQGWEGKAIWDPAHDNPRPPGDASFRVRNNDVFDAVYVPYDAKQNDPTLESRGIYEMPPVDESQRGTVSYVPYTTILGDEGHYLGVYLPAGYDPDRAEPYKVIYAAHGIFGDETDYMIPLPIPNILDNMVARGEIEPTVLVTMGNHFTGTGLNFASYNQQNASNNLVDVILPFIEENYNVSDEASGRAYSGFSYGGMTASYVLRDHPTTFSYYGLFSGNPSLNATQYDNIAADAGDQLSIFLGNGIFEGTTAAMDTIADNFTSRGIPAVVAQVPGSHNGMTAGQLFTIWGKNYLWASTSEALAPGTTVVADPESPTGYTVTFVYNNPDATQVKLGGDLTLLDLATGNGTRYQPEDWQTGRYHAGGVEFLRDMVKDADGNWSISLPLHAGGLSYWYRVWDPAQGWENKRIWDPAHTNPRPPGDASFRVRNNDVLDAVHVPYDATQNDPILEGRGIYEVPPVDASQRGTVSYVPYTTILGDEGHYLGVYLPAGYDPDRAKPYKVVYAAHGIFGDETDFMVPVNAPTILDNMIARGEIEPTVVVTMGNHFTGTGLNFASYNQQNASNNLVDVILPFIEENYNVSDKASGRGYMGFSYGGMTGSIVIREHPTTFGYYGFFSGNPSLNATQYDNIAADAGDQLSIFLGNGIFEGTPAAMNTIAENFKSRGVSAEVAQVPGAHDGMTAGQLFTIFAKNYLWANSGDVKSVRNITDMGSYGQQVVATVLEYADVVDASALSVDGFAASDTAFNFRFDNISTLNDLEPREIADVYTVADPSLLLENDRPAAEGRFVVIEYEPDLELGWTTITVPGNPWYVMVNPNQPTEVVQIDDVLAKDGSVLAEGSASTVWTPNADPINRQVDQFVHGVFEASVGPQLYYDYRLPANYDPSKKYPVVVALPGMGQGYDGANNLRVHLTTDMLAPAWASHEWIGRDEDVIVLAPQNQRVGAATEGQQTAELIEYFSAEFAVDTRRIYTTSVSYGSTLMWWLLANRPDLFAGALMTGGFPNNAEQALAIANAEVPMFITHGVHDLLLPVANSRASYQRIVDAYKAKGLSDEAISSLVRWIEYDDDAYDLPDHHLASAPTLEDKSIMQWLLDQVQPPKVTATVGARCVAGKAMPTITVTNEDNIPVSVAVTSAYGVKAFGALAPSKSGFHAYTTRLASMPSGTMTLNATATVNGYELAKTLQVTYPAYSCG